MPFDKSCFISYRPIPSNDYKATLQDFYKELEGEILYWLTLNSYVDLQRTDSDFVNQTLAATLCRSVCMVVLYIPPYFDLNYTHCAREYKAMEDLEAKRMALLGHTDKKTQGLIIPIIFRGWDDSFPDEIKKERTCYNFEPYLIGKKLSKHRKVKEEISKIAKYIFGRYQALRSVRPDPCGTCTGFSYPSATDVLAWLTVVQGARNKFPRL